ncbi:hypothetical protein [Mesorhizobium sp. B2-4-6]|uniref:hypothetical protein n=1 Tax=Mesorhizobium sp. B2-4-6 TaxID=2589943 RepID=UPI00112C6511|nr:hypothetical protein [Mesorhizobium sp. B2-4-6]TPL49774.1 hypothetical protein FJ957_11965 [Mesorhizobium sp. B2-4-6]
MTSQVNLIGYADTVGMDLGFLVPVFDRRPSNALLVQRLSSSGKIIDFEAVDNIDSNLVYIDRKVVKEGEDAIWAFSFSKGDIIAGRNTEFRDDLMKRINDPALADRPFLSIEIAEFLDMPKRRLSLARKALRSLSKLDTKAARTWMDLSILTTDLRRALSRISPQYTVAVKRLVATVDDDRVRLRGIAPGLSNESIHQIANVTRQVLEDLSSLYQSGSGRWDIRIVQRDPKRESPTAEAVVWLSDRSDIGAQPYLADRSLWRIDAYRPDEIEDFKAAALSRDVPAFVVFRGESLRTIQEIEDALRSKATSIQLIPQSRFKVATYDSLFDRSAESPRVCVPMGGFMGTRVPDSTTSRIVRQVIAATLAINGYSRRLETGEKFLFFRTTGTGTTPSTDAWATLYDRAFAVGLSAASAYTLASLGEPRNDEDNGTVHDLLFPNSHHLRDPRVDSAMKHARAHAAILLAAKPRDREDWTAHVRAVRGVLSRRGWRPKDGNDEYELNLEAEDSSKQYLLRARSEPVDGKPSWDPSELMRSDLQSINTFSFTEDGNTPNILARLYRHGELVVNMRDICGSEATGGVWSILAAQLRRLTSGQMNRARSHFMAMLINCAFRHGHVTLQEAGVIGEAIDGPSLGNEIQLMWSRVRQTRGETRASVRLLAGLSNPFHQPGHDLIPPFSIALGARGVHVFGDDVS